MRTLDGNFAWGQIGGESDASAHAILADCIQKGELTPDEEIAMYEHIRLTSRNGENRKLMPSKDHSTKKKMLQNFLQFPRAILGSSECSPQSFLGENSRSVSEPWRSAALRQLKAHLSSERL
jgi:hypothetical protein